MSFQIFATSYRINGINRSFLNIPISIFESSIPLVQDVAEPEIYYDKALLESQLTSYFDKTIDKYCNDYSLSFYYYSQEDESICVNDKCTAIEITLKAEVILLINYQRSARFYIQDNTL